MPVAREKRLDDEKDKPFLQKLSKELPRLNVGVTEVYGLLRSARGKQESRGIILE